MSSQSDEELLEELRKRFTANRQALYDLKMTTRKLEEVNTKLQESEAIKSHFISNIKNEINNPLTSILGLSQQIASKPNMDRETVTMLAEMIHHEAFDLDFHLRNIFAAGVMESGSVEINVSMVDVGALVRSTVRSFVHRIQEKNIAVSVVQPDTAEEEQLLFKTDSEKLSMVLFNLLANAIEFSHENGTVEVILRINERRLQLSVEDHGIGIDSSQVHRIFDRFVQLDSGTTKKHGGQGLGLSVSKALIDLMEGEITVSCEKGTGCCFTITVPEVEVDIDASSFSVDGNEFLFGDEGMEAF